MPEDDSAKTVYRQVAMRMPSVGHAVKPVPEYVINSAPPSLEAAELSTSLTSNRYFVAGIRFSGYDAKLKRNFLNSAVLSTWIGTALQ